MPVAELVLFFDGNCPFCAAEMSRLKKWDTHQRLGFVDIAQPGFNANFLGVDMIALGTELHSQRADGVVLVGIDSMLLAYTLVNKAWLVWPLRIGFLRPFLSALYRRFARNRYTLSRWLGYANVPTCQDGVCSVSPYFKK